MKKIVFAFIVAAALAGCIKNDLPVYTTPLVEFDATSWNANAAGVTYPMITQAPTVYGRVVIPENNSCNAAVDPYVTRTSGTIRYRVNMIGQTSSSDREIGVTTFTVPFTSYTFRKKTPTCANYTLALTNAVLGTDYTLVTNKIKIPKDSTYGFVDINIINNGALAGQGKVIGLMLDSTGNLLPSPNYRQLAIVVDQR